MQNVKIWQSYRKFKGGNFLRHSVEMEEMHGKAQSVARPVQTRLQTSRVTKVYMPYQISPR